MEEMNPVQQVCVQNGENKQDGMNARDIALMYSSSIVFKRWAGTAIDMILMMFMYFSSLLTLGIPEKSLLRIVSSYIPLLSYILFIAYYIVIEGITGCTLGKIALKIRAVDLNYNPPGVLKGFLRTITRLIELNPILIGGIPAGIIALCSKSKQRLGDMAAGTYVLETKDIPDYKKHLQLKGAKKVIVTTFAVLAAVSFLFDIVGLAGFFKDAGTGCFSKNEKVLYSKNQKYQLTLPSGWSDYNGLLQENEETDLGAVNIYRNAFFTAMTQEKSSFSEGVDFKIYVEAAKATLNGRFTGCQIINTVETSINGHTAVQLEVKCKLENEEVFSLVTLLETKEAYHMLTAWMPEKYADSDGKSELVKVTLGFKEAEIEKG